MHVGISYLSESVESCRVFNHDLSTQSRIGHPDRQLVEQQTVVDLKEWRDISRAPTGDMRRIRMRPLRTPQYSLRLADMSACASGATSG
jgi:hypothetical protein